MRVTGNFRDVKMLAGGEIFLGVLVFHCLVANHHKSGSLKQYTCFTSVSVVRSPGAAELGPLLRASQATGKVSAGCRLIRGLKNHLPTSFKLLGEFISLWPQKREP